MTGSVIVAGARTPMGRLLGQLKDFSATQLGGVAIIVAGGQESMTQAPHLLPKSRAGFKYGDVAMIDHMAYDGLHDSFDQVSMGASTEKHNARHQLTRVEQDEFAAQSHQRAGRAVDSGLFAEEITPVTVPQRKGDPVVVSTDEGIRPDTTAEGLSKLRPAFSADGTITAGSSSPITDGAAAVVVMSKDKAAELGLSWLAEIGAHGMVAGPDDSSLHEQPANAVLAACRKEGIEVSDLDIVEINEAFAAVGVVSTRKLGIDLAQVNPNGGAIALGHPIGASGARLALHLAVGVQSRGGGVGAASLCGGGGQGDALILRVPGNEAA